MSEIMFLSPQGRTSIPASIRRQAGIDGQEKMTVNVIGPGRILLETPAAAFASLFEQFPECVDSTTDAAAEVRAMREEDIRISNEKFHRIEKDSPSSEFTVPGVASFATWEEASEYIASQSQ